MNITEVITSIALIGLAIGIGTLVFGFIVAIKIAGGIAAFTLLMIGVNALTSHAEHKVTESISKKKAEREGQMYVHSAFSARDTRDEIESQKEDSTYIDAEYTKAK